MKRSPFLAVLESVDIPLKQRSVLPEMTFPPVTFTISARESSILLFHVGRIKELFVGFIFLQTVDELFRGFRSFEAVQDFS